MILCDTKSGINIPSIITKAQSFQVGKSWIFMLEKVDISG